MISTSTLSDRRGLWAFALGVAGVTAGVLLHLPMFLMGRAMHFRLYGMPMGSEMYVGMAAIMLLSIQQGTPTNLLRFSRMAIPILAKTIESGRIILA